MKRFLKRSGISTIFVLIVAAMAVSPVLTGCGGGGGTPTRTTTQPPLSTTTTSDPLAFPAGKYVKNELYNGLFRLAYTVGDDGIIAIGIKAKTVGWVAIAIGNPHGTSDVIIGYIENGQVTLLDTHDARESGGHPLDSAFGGTSDLFAISGSEANGITTIEFKRKLNTGDQFDLRLIVGTNTLTWAFGVNDSLAQEHSLVGLAVITVPESTHP
jgi:hypothetical protein